MTRYHLLFPMCSALLYAFSAISIKRAIDLGMGPWRMTFLSNIVMLLVFGLPILTVEGTWFGDPWWPPVVTGCLFLSGQVFTFLSLTRGEVSIATPVLGGKVILVAFFLVIFTGETLGLEMWISACLALVGVILLHFGGKIEHRGRTIKTVLLATGSAASFAGADVIFQSWVPGWGFKRFVFASSGTTLLLSLALVPLFKAPLWRWPEGAKRYVVPALFLLAFQAVGMAVAIGVYQDAAGANVVYATRGLWSVFLVWIVGHWFANDEKSQGTAVMVGRALGALLLLAAVVLLFV